MWLEKFQRERRVKFCDENPIEGEDGIEDFLDEDILDVELRTWKMYFDGAVNQYRNGIRKLLITPKGDRKSVV